MKANPKFEEFVLRDYRTHRSASDAFRDAEYASPITYFESETQRGLRMLSEWLVLGSIFFVVGSLVYYAIEAIK